MSLAAVTRHPPAPSLSLTPGRIPPSSTRAYAPYTIHRMLHTASFPDIHRGCCRGTGRPPPPPPPLRAPPASRLSRRSLPHPFLSSLRPQVPGPKVPRVEPSSPHTQFVALLHCIDDSSSFCDPRTKACSRFSDIHPIPPSHHHHSYTHSHVHTFAHSQFTLLVLVRTAILLPSRTSASARARGPPRLSHLDLAVAGEWHRWGGGI
ncbi:hypothetical protein C8Q78DRAFT_1002405 [Trametes maxima]|nr:hypothetical protein C8Q78DRAFT_1002405 [Trametes maxima]